MARMAQSTIEERLNEQSRRIKMLEEVFVPMAKNAMEIIAGKPGEPGMAENLRNVGTDLKALVEAHAREAEETERLRADGFKRIETLERFRKTQEEQKQEDKDIKLMGIKVSADTKTAFISGLFMLLGILITGLLK